MPSSQVSCSNCLELVDKQVDSWTHDMPSKTNAHSAESTVPWWRYLWHMCQGAFLLAICLAAAGWILWKKFGQRWWYLQQQRGAQAIAEMSNEDLHRLLGGKHIPSWVNFPDFQRVQWVNDVIGQYSSAAYCCQCLENTTLASFAGSGTFVYGGIHSTLCVITSRLIIMVDFHSC